MGNQYLIPNAKSLLPSHSDIINLCDDLESKHRPLYMTLQQRESDWAFPREDAEKWSEEFPRVSLVLIENERVAAGIRYEVYSVKRLEVETA